MRRTILAGAAALLILAPPGPGAAQVQDDSARAAAAIRAQHLRPGDVIRLQIWREPLMSGEFLVDEAGIVVFPRIGEYRVLDETPESLEAKLLAAYRKYLRNPSIDVTVLRRIRIMGAVKSPGLYPVDPTVTVADAIALAGGATPIGDPTKVQIIRNDEVVTTELNQNTRLADSPIQSGDQLFVPERSWVARNSNVVAATIAGLMSLVIALFIR